MAAKFFWRSHKRRFRSNLVCSRSFCLSLSLVLRPPKSTRFLFDGSPEKNILPSRLSQSQSLTLYIYFANQPLTINTYIYINVLEAKFRESEVRLRMIPRQLSNRVCPKYSVWMQRKLRKKIERERERERLGIFFSGFNGL